MGRGNDENLRPSQPRLPKSHSHADPHNVGRFTASNPSPVSSSLRCHPTDHPLQNKHSNLNENSALVSTEWLAGDITTAIDSASTGTELAFSSSELPARKETGVSLRPWSAMDSVSIYGLQPYI